ncbi:MAG: glycosyl hydrolase [Acidobacteria bacterium]|nr:glycosyl hydrolase [Acidobacteriota bacterium]MCI0628891.1 glycosyl hydrolase [Acidobacteriota bacterium]MCI0718114.1 glycosyl hydrolase [Acidobacteriota bacterium]
MIQIDSTLAVHSLAPQLDRLFELSARKIRLLQERWNPSQGAPVFTVEGNYTSRGWTEWTQGFQFGSAILQFDATGDESFLEIGRLGTVQHMASHVSHVGVHDHGFNNISTYGNLRRLMNEARIPSAPWERHFCELALKVSGAVQAARWTDLGNDQGFIFSFNGPHSLFADTIRSLRSLAVAHQLGHVLMSEKDSQVSLLHRLVRHAETTARYSVYFGNGRDAYDVPGRVAHESIFNVRDGSYRCPSSQQGYSPFTTWTRGQAWILCGYAEQLEFLQTLGEEELKPYGGKTALLAFFKNVAETVANHYLEQAPTDGIVYWDTGAPDLARMGDYLSRASEPDNPFEPVDSSAAAIAAQGLLRLGWHLQAQRDEAAGARYCQAALTIAKHLFAPPYLSENPGHEGLILHSVYHRPNGWDHTPPGKRIPMGEATMWGDYHARELGLMLLRATRGEPDYRFFS